MEIHQKIVQIGALAATFWAKQKIEKTENFRKKIAGNSIFSMGIVGGGLSARQKIGAELGIFAPKTDSSRDLVAYKQ